MRRTHHAYLAPGARAEMPADIQAMMDHLDALDPLIHQPTRLRLLAFLAKQPEAVSFQTLLERLRLRTSNLSIQLTRLERAGLLVTDKRARGRYYETTVAMTQAGREALARHLEHVCAALDLMSRQEEC